MNTWTKVCLMLSVLFLGACKRPLPLLTAREIPPRSPERLLERLLENETDTFSYYSARSTISLKLPQGGRTFKAQIRVARDSAAWVSVIPALGIEVARVLMTPDSLKILDKLHDQFFVGDMNTTKEKFGLQPSLELLQMALSGKPIGLDPNEKYRSDREDGQYVLTSREKRRFVRAAEDMSPGDTLPRDRDMGERRFERTIRRAEEREAVIHRFWIDPETYRVTRVQITDIGNDKSADIHYEERAGAEEGHLPIKIRITLSEPGRQATGTMELSRITLEGPLQFSFNIPEKYEPMP
jgi:hypothetical protein